MIMAIDEMIFYDLLMVVNHRKSYGSMIGWIHYLRQTSDVPLIVSSKFLYPHNFFFIFIAKLQTQIVTWNICNKKTWCLNLILLSCFFRSLNPTFPVCFFLYWFFQMSYTFVMRIVERPITGFLWKTCEGNKKTC